MATSHDLQTLREELERAGYSKEHEFIYLREWEAREGRQFGSPDRRPLIRDGHLPAGPRGILDRLAEFFRTRLSRSNTDWRP